MTKREREKEKNWLNRRESERGIRGAKNREREKGKDEKRLTTRKRKRQRKTLRKEM